MFVWVFLVSLVRDAALVTFLKKKRLPENTSNQSALKIFLIRELCLIGNKQVSISYSFLLGTSWGLSVYILYMYI